MTPRHEVVRHESAGLGRLERGERGPAPQLRGLIHRYCGDRHDGTGGARRLEVAQAHVTVILGFDPPLRVGGPTRPAADEPSFVAAPYDSYAITEEYGALAGIQVDLSPLGAHMLFGVAMHELSAQLVVGLEDVLGREGVELVERVEGLRAWEAGSRPSTTSSRGASSARAGPRPMPSGPGAGCARAVAASRSRTSRASSAAARAISSHHRRARDAGAEIVDGPQTVDYGRFYSARDPDGNLWSFGTYAPGE